MLAVLATALGFGLRVFLLSLDSNPHGLATAAIIGIFEGVSLHRTLLSEPPIDSLSLCSLRLLFDLVFTELPFLSLFSTFALTFLLCDAVSRTPPEDISKLRRRSWRFLRFVGRSIVESEFWRRHTRPTRREPEVKIATPPNRRVAPPLVGPSGPPSALNPDELLTPSSLAASPLPPPRLQSPPVSFTVPARDPGDESDELQTPLELNIVGLPVSNVPIALVREPSSDEQAEAAPAPAPNAPAPEPDTLSPGTEFTALTGVEGKAVYARAEAMRKDAHEAEEEKARLEVQLQAAIEEKRTKDAFLLRREIESAEEKIKKLHAGAARRYFRSGNPPGSEDVTVDVQGLLIPEAVESVQAALHGAILDGKPELKVILLKGKASKKNKLKPELKAAIQEAVEKEGISCNAQSSNPGILVITIPP